MSDVPHDPYQSTPEDSMEGNLPEPDADACNWAMLAHLSGLSGYVVPIPCANVVAPLLIWNLKREMHPFVDDQAKEALNFQISMLIYVVVALALICAVVGIVLAPVVAVAGAIYSVLAAIKASKGEAYRYPLTIRFVK